MSSPERSESPVRSFVFCETAAHVRIALNRPAAVVAVMPEAAWHLRQRGIRYVKLDDYCSDAELSDLSDAVLRRQIAWRVDVDRWLQQRVPEWKGAGFQPVKLTLYYLKIFFDELLLRTRILVRFFEQAKPDVVTFFRPRGVVPTEWHLFFQESVYALLLPVVASRFGARLEPLTIGADRIAPEGYVPRSGWRALAAPVWKRLPAALRSRLKSSSTNTLGTRSDKPLMCLGDGYDLTEVRREAAHRHLEFLSASTFAELVRDQLPAGESVPLRAIWHDLVGQDMFWDLCRPEGFDLRSIAEPRLERWWNSAVGEVWRAFQACQSTLRQQPMSVLLTIPAATPFELGLLGGARAAGVPVALFQHGGFIGNCDQIGWDIADLSLADYSFVYGPGVKSYVEERAVESPVKLASPVAVGSPRLDKVRRGIVTDRRTAIRQQLGAAGNTPLVLYVPTIFGGYTRQLCRDSYPEVSYFELQTEIFQIFAAHPDVRLIYKAFVSAVPSPIKAALTSLCPSARWITSPSLTELVWAIDAMIIDFPSTALLEAVLTPTPLVIFADEQSLRFRPEARVLLSGQRRLASTREDFLNAIRSLLAGRDYAPIADSDPAFERAYGTHVGDGRSASRAIDALQEIVRTSQQFLTPSTGVHDHRP